MPAVRAFGVRQDQVVDFLRPVLRQAERLAGLLPPFQFHHPRQAVDDHIEEAADQQAEQGSTENKGQRLAGQ
ncbi:hypothetical protein FQZ97_642160 [compost metagenome]